MNSSLSSAQKRCALALFLSVRSYRVHSLPISSISFRFLRLISMVYCLSIRTHTQTPIRSVSLRWSAEASEQRAAWVKRTQHHYMFNGMRLFVWPKKMEIRFICWIIPKLCVCVAFREVVRVKCSVLNHKTESAERCGNYKNESKNIGLFKSIQRMDEAHNFKLLKLLFHRSALCSRPKHLHLFGCLKF